MTSQQDLERLGLQKQRKEWVLKKKRFQRRVETRVRLQVFTLVAQQKVWWQGWEGRKASQEHLDLVLVHRKDVIDGGKGSVHRSRWEDELVTRDQCMCNKKHNQQ